MSVLWDEVGDVPFGVVRSVWYWEGGRGGGVFMMDFQ